MTQKEIEQARKRLVAIKKVADSGKRNKAFIVLAAEVGATGCPRDMPTIGERDAEHIRSIHQALQTAIMINMCKISSKNYKIAIIAAIAAALSAFAAWFAFIAK